MFNQTQMITNKHRCVKNMVIVTTKMASPPWHVFPLYLRYLLQSKIQGGPRSDTCTAATHRAGITRGGI
jgi:hypothetical protein